jgi:hypothetical protein
MVWLNRINPANRANWKRKTSKKAGKGSLKIEKGWTSSRNVEEEVAEGRRRNAANEGMNRSDERFDTSSKSLESAGRTESFAESASTGTIKEGGNGLGRMGGLGFIL